MTADGDVLVADFGADRVRRIGSDGRVDTVAAVRRPVDVAVAPAGGLVVAGADGRVELVEAGGDRRLLGRFGRDPAVTVAADGAVLVAEARRHRIVRVRPDGATELVVASSCRTGGGLLGFVTALAVAPDGSLLATDAGAGRVLAISGPLIRVVAGAGLAYPRDACRSDRSRRALAALSPPPRASADDIYSTPSCPAARDVPPFNVKLRSVRPARPRARQRFAVRGSTSMRARIFLRAKRRAVTRRTKAIRPRGSTFTLVFKRGLPRAGTYKLLLVADNARGERACARAKIRIVPGRSEGIADLGPAAVRRVVRRRGSRGGGGVGRRRRGAAVHAVPRHPAFSPTDLSASVKILQVESDVTRDEWRWRLAAGDARRHAQLARLDRRYTGFTDGCAGGGELGFVVYARVEASGFKRRSLSVRSQLYDRRTGRRVVAADVFQRLARVPVDAPTEASVAQLFLTQPQVEQTFGTRVSLPAYTARVELYDADDHLLDVAESEPFRAFQERHAKCSNQAVREAVATAGTGVPAGIIAAAVVVLACAAVLGVRRLRRAR